ncbi:hypothetical protein UlMin_026528 [Ulmus minor]
MQVQIISRETIRPSSPTPPHKKIYNLSLFDLISPRVHIPIVYFYKSTTSSTVNISHLKISLSKTLARYYPFAGRLNDGVSMECKDEGIVFIEATISSNLTEILENPKYETLDSLFPDGLRWKDWTGGSCLAIQVSFFNCGGLAIAMCMSHKLADANTICQFFNTWAAMARVPVGRDESTLPELNAASIFPRGNMPGISGSAKFEKGNNVSKRFVFEASKIASLKAMVGEKVQTPTRVQVVTALIQKCAISASRRINTGTSNPSIMIQSVNLRSRMVPPVPENCAGNMTWFFSIHTYDGRNQAINTFKRLRGEEGPLLIKELLKESKRVFQNENLVKYNYTSWCRFLFYEADFGWGKPIWVTNGGCVFKDTVMMMDTRNGDGIEAFVNLEKEEMELFENDMKLLGFASLNPSVI